MQFVQAAACALQPMAVRQSSDTAVLEAGVPPAALLSDHVPLVARFQASAAAGNVTEHDGAAGDR